MIVNPSHLLSSLRIKNKDRIIIGHLNINHLENKFEPLVPLVQGKVDIFFCSETKIGSSYPNVQCLIDGYTSPFRMDQDTRGGGILLYVRDDIPRKQIKVNTFPNDIECLLIEVRIRNTKYILVAGYCSHKEMASYFLGHVGKALDVLLSEYDNILILGEFNSTQKEPWMKDFCETYNLENLFEELTCFKNTENPSSIDVMLTNTKNSFQDSKAVETGLSDYHKMTVSV